MKQTAVEWLVNELNNHPAFQGQFFKEVFEQAKEMEKQQIIDANRDGADMVIDNMTFITGEQYYEKTFNK